MKLTENFHLSEFLDNDHSFEIAYSEVDLKNIKTLCTDILQPLREEFNVPIHINSGLRSVGLNALVGGKKRHHTSRPR